MSLWYYTTDNRSRTGPVTSEQLRELAASGVLRPEHSVTLDGAGKWKPARKVKGLFPSPEAPAPVVGSLPPQPAKQQPPVAHTAPMLSDLQLPVTAGAGPRRRGPIVAVAGCLVLTLLVCAGTGIMGAKVAGWLKPVEDDRNLGVLAGNDEDASKVPESAASKAPKDEVAPKTPEAGAVLTIADIARAEAGRWLPDNGYADEIKFAHFCGAQPVLADKYVGRRIRLEITHSSRRIDKVAGGYVVHCYVQEGVDRWELARYSFTKEAAAKLADLPTNYRPMVTGTFVEYTRTPAQGMRIPSDSAIPIFKDCELTEAKIKQSYPPGAALEIVAAHLKTGDTVTRKGNDIVVKLRRHNFAGPVELDLENLPAGLDCVGFNAHRITVSADVTTIDIPVAVTFGQLPYEANLRVVARSKNLTAGKALRIRVLPTK